MALDNVKVTQEGDLVTIEIDLGQNFGTTESGATRVASTHGWADLAPGVRFSLNAVTSAKMRERASKAENDAYNAGVTAGAALTAEAVANLRKQWEAEQADVKIAVKPAKPAAKAA